MKMASLDDVLGIYGKMSTLKDMKKVSKDRLKPLIDYTLGKVLLKPIKLIVFYVFCQYFMGTSIAIYHILDRFDTQALLRHGSFVGIQLFVLINLGCVLLLTEDLAVFLKKYTAAVLPIEMLNEKTLKKVLFSIKMIKLISAINMTFATFAAAGFIAAPDYFDEKSYFCVWIQKTFPNYAENILKVLHWSSIVVALVLAGSAVGFAYGSCTAIFQIMVIHEMISTISNSALPEEMRRDSKLYQEAVRQKMIMSIMVHQYTVRFQAVASDIIELPMMLLSIGSLILGGSLMIEFFTNQDQDLGDNYEIYVGIFCFAVAGVISTNTYLIIGQVIKDESERCHYKLCQLPWYDMDEANEKIYSIFLDRSSKNLALSNSLVQVDYDLLVKIVKSLYSLAAVLSRFVSATENKK